VEDEEEESIDYNDEEEEDSSSQSSLEEDLQEEAELRMIISKRGNRKRLDSFEEEDQDAVVDLTRMTKRQRMAYMQQGATTEIGRHNKGSVLEQGDD
jgi:hypothetical protein